MVSARSTMSSPSCCIRVGMTISVKVMANPGQSARDDAGDRPVLAVLFEIEGPPARLGTHAVAADLRRIPRPAFAGGHGRRAGYPDVARAKVDLLLLDHREG